MLRFSLFALLITHSGLAAFSLEQEIVRLNAGTFKDSRVMLLPKKKPKGFDHFNLANVEYPNRFTRLYRFPEIYAKISGRFLSIKDQLAEQGIFIIKNYEEESIRVKKVMGDSWRIYLEGSKGVIDQSNIYNAQGGIEFHW